MEKIILKGGYGEHGRSCFMIPQKSYYVMLDCGILDTDPNPYPELSKELVEATKYLVITHCHKDHVGAFSYLLALGFCGTLITTRATYELAKIEYGKVEFVDAFPYYKKMEDMEFSFGRSGHCPGAIWVSVKTEKTSYFYSGDYQENGSAYVCDEVKGLQCELGIVDLAHKNKGSAKKRKDAFEQCVKKYLYENKKILLPVQQYGRGIEILYHLLQFVPSNDIAMDPDFSRYLEKSLEYPEYLTSECMDTIKAFQKCYDTTGKGDIVLLGDTHIEKQSTKQYVDEQSDFILIVTGRVKKGGYIETLLQQNKAVKKPYIHHQSKEDMEQLLQANKIKVVLPFHNNEKEVIIK